MAGTWALLSTHRNNFQPLFCSHLVNGFYVCRCNWFTFLKSSVSRLEYKAQNGQFAVSIAKRANEETGGRRKPKSLQPILTSFPSHNLKWEQLYAFCQTISRFKSVLPILTAKISNWNAFWTYARETFQCGSALWH